MFLHISVQFVGAKLDEKAFDYFVYSHCYLGRIAADCLVVYGRGQWMSLLRNDYKDKGDK